MNLTDCNCVGGLTVYPKFSLLIPRAFSSGFFLGSKLAVAMAGSTSQLSSSPRLEFSKVTVHLNVCITDQAVNKAECFSYPAFILG